jgi:hypothetical protein
LNLAVRQASKKNSTVFDEFVGYGSRFELRTKATIFAPKAKMDSHYRPKGDSGSRPISRVLSWTVIHLGCTSPYTSRDLPGSHAGRT